MRDLSSDDLGNLLAFFAVLLLAFAANFHFSKKAARNHRRIALISVIVNFVGEVAAAIALLLTWVALWSPKAWERIDDMLVLVPGSIAVLSAMLLTFESVTARALAVIDDERRDQREGLYDKPKKKKKKKAYPTR